MSKVLSQSVKMYDPNIKLDIMKEPLFFGLGRNIQRYDIMKHSIFYDFGQNMDENFWKPAEIDLTQDVLDFKNLSPSEEHIFTSNLKRQIVLDSIMGHAPLDMFGRVCTNSAFEYSLTRLQYQETNHSDAYSYILRNVYDNPSEVFDTILSDEVITRHTESITEAYENFYALINKWEYLKSLENDKSIFASTEKGLRKVLNSSGLLKAPTLHEMKVALWKALIAWNILEGMRFFVSFACTFSFAENKKMIGNAQELKLIARDEIVHLQMSQKTINILKNNEDEGFFDVIEECKDEVTKMFEEAALNETEWAEYLFKDGSIIGLNTQILTRYMKHITNTRRRAIREPKMFEEIKYNPLPWIDAWLGQGKEEVLPQQVEITDYKIGVISDMEDSEWNDI